MPELYPSYLFNDANLVSYYRFEGNSNDSKGSNNGTPTGITYNASYGKFGQGARFVNASSSHIAFGDPASLRFGTGGFTMNTWLSLDAIGSLTAMLHKDPDGTGFYCFCQTSGIIATNNLLTVGGPNFLTALVAGTMTMVTISRDGSGNIRLYLNGKIDNTASGTNKDISKVGTGMDYGIQNGWYPTCNLDELSLFSKGLSDGEVRDLFNLTRGRYLGNQSVHRSNSY